MEKRNIESLQPNPNNEHKFSDEGKALLLHAMSLGDHGVFLITPEGMIINGNNRWHLRIEARWDDKEVYCRILTYGQNSEGFYAVIDGQTVLDGEVAPHYYVSIEALYAAYAFTANGEAGYYEKSVMNKFDEWKLDPAKFSGSFFPPTSFKDSMASLKDFQKKKKYQVIVNCINEEDLNNKYQQITDLGIAAKKKE